MKIENLKRHADGSHTFDAKATEEEVNILVNIALDALISMGKLSYEEVQGKTIDIDLNEVDIEHCFKAG
jgi:hypothetical protein